MKCLFLDIDGVLNSSEYLYTDRYKKLQKIEPWPECMLDPHKVKMLNNFIQETGVEIVISSTWRQSESIKNLNKMLGSKGLNKKILDVTPTIYISSDNKTTPCDLYERGMEIDYWLKNFAPCSITSFVIFDDDCDLNPHMDKLVKTIWKKGLQPKHIRKAKEILSLKEK